MAAARSSAEIVAALRAVPGVSAAQVQLDPEGGSVGHLRLGLYPGVDEVAVASSVGDLLRERFGMGLDAHQVELIEEPVPPASPAAASPADAAANGHAAPPRLTIRRMQLVSAGLQVTATVSLGLGERTESGHATGAAAPSTVYRAVANATVRALEHFTGEQARFEVETVDLVGGADQRTVVATVTMVSADGAERLTGTSAVRDDVRSACIRAVLDATNRRAAPLLA